jgi:hypothetical protein
VLGSIFLLGVLDGEVVNDQCKSNGSRVVLPQASGDVSGAACVGHQDFLQVVIGKFASLLRESAHALCKSPRARGRCGPSREACGDP